MIFTILEIRVKTFLKHLLIMQSKRRTSKTSNALNESWLFDDTVEKKNNLLGTNDSLVLTLN